MQHLSNAEIQAMLRQLAKFRYVIETSIQPAQLLTEAEGELTKTRAEMLQLALPLYKQMYPGQDDYSNLPALERENKIIAAVLNRISDEHPQRDQLMEVVKADLDGIKQFIRHLLGRRIPRRAAAGAECRGAVLGHPHRSQDARSESGEQAARVQQLRAAVAHHS